ncbi:MAG: hypothetical protein KTR15_09190 [Phycisphaeraceae bacterium]|nr:hypothetical protein [Phycisphaeraceae bacterium]
MSTSCNNRYDFKKRGQHFVWLLIGLTIGLALVYVGLKIIWNPTDKDSQPRVKDYAFVDPHGQLIVTDAITMNWYVDEINSAEIIARMKATYTRMNTLRDQIYISLPVIAQERKKMTGIKDATKSNPLPSYLTNKQSNTLIGQLGRGKHKQAIETWSQTTAAEVVDRGNKFASSYEQIQRVSKNLNELNVLYQNQAADLKALSPPQIGVHLFWTSCWRSMLEVIFFSVFGVLANLLVNSAMYVRSNEFRPSERYVAFTKLIYAPILSMVLVLGVMFGWLDFGSYEVRVFSLPLIAFILGYFSRRVVTLFDRFGTRVLGAAEKSIEAGPAAIAKRRKQLLKEQMSVTYPGSLSELRAEAIALAAPTVRNIVIEKESAS